MKMNWQAQLGKSLNVTMHENYGVSSYPGAVEPFFELSAASGRLIDAFEDGLLLETEKEKNERFQIFIPYTSIKFVEIY